MMIICPTCIPEKRTTTVAPRKIKSLVYIDVKGNTEEVIDNMYEKDPRPNFHFEMGYDDSPESPDRFDAVNYDDMVAKILASPLDLPPELDD